jgi:hypothetical protein
VIRELGRAYLKRPGRGVPPPRSGPPPPVVPELPVHVYENSGGTRGAA